MEEGDKVKEGSHQKSIEGEWVQTLDDQCHMDKKKKTNIITTESNQISHAISWQFFVCED